MRTRAAVITLIPIVTTLIAGGCGAPQVDWELAVGGAVDTPLTLTFVDLVEMPQTNLKDLPPLSGRMEAIESWSGVPLTEILKLAGAGTVSGIAAIGADGYAVEIGAAELEDGIVALKQNGEWIAQADPEHGPIRLVTPHTPTNRWVFQLVEIQVLDALSGGGIPADAAFKITSAVETEIGWTEDQLRARDTIEDVSTNKAGETKTYAGVAVKDPLEKPPTIPTLPRPTAADAIRCEASAGTRRERERARPPSWALRTRPSSPRGLYGRDRGGSPI